jgi:hypothetical protein
MMGRMNIYRVKEAAQDIARRTGGEFMDEEFEDEFGSFWVVIWR